MKQYQTPKTVILKIRHESNLLAGTGAGASSGSPVNDEYNSTDVSYSRSQSIWGSDDDE